MKIVDGWIVGEWESRPRQPLTPGAVVGAIMGTFTPSTTFLFRPQRGGYQDSMSEARSFGSRAELEEYLLANDLGVLIDITPYGDRDQRNGWLTHAVNVETLEGRRVVGFTDRPVSP